MIYYLIDEPFSAITGLALSSAAANLMRFNQNSAVTCPQADNTWGVETTRIVRIPFFFITHARGWRFVGLAIRQQLICRLFEPLLSRVEAGDTVSCFNVPVIAGALAAAIHLKGAKLVYHAHNSLAPLATKPFFKCFIPDAFIFNSEAMRQEALGLMPYLKNTCTIYNGVDELLFYPSQSSIERKSSVPVILYVGRLVHIKGVHVLLEAMRLLRERNVEANCRVIGSSHAGGHRDRVTRYIKSLHQKCPPNVRFEGFRPATCIAREYRSADILCCPSICQEAFGNVNVEAMASGIPVVASGVGGIPEIAQRGGIVLVQANSPTELADALQTLVQNADLRRTIGQKGLASFRERFTWSAVFTQHQNLIDSLHHESPRDAASLRVTK